jgi:hypothetical protein
MLDVADTVASPSAFVDRLRTRPAPGCTAPRKLDGAENHELRLLTHFESDYGAAPKVEFR